MKQLTTRPILNLEPTMRKATHMNGFDKFTINSSVNCAWPLEYLIMIGGERNFDNVCK